MSKQNRRQFILATAAAGLVSTIPGRANASRVMVEGLYQAAGQELELMSTTCGSRDRVRVISVEDLPGHGLKQFVLHLEGTSSPQLPEGIYQACSEPGDVDMAMHIMPTEKNQYVAYFALVGD